MVPREGLEPPTSSLEVSCSIQLSYRGIKTKYGAGWGNRTPVLSLENLYISRYTNPAFEGDYSTIHTNSTSVNDSQFLYKSEE